MERLGGRIQIRPKIRGTIIWWFKYVDLFIQMKQSILRNLLLKWQVRTWRWHNWLFCRCPICKLYRFENRVNFSEDM